MIEEFKRLKEEANEKMDKTIHHLKEEYKKLRTGKANIAMVEDIQFDFYGTKTPIKQAANLSTPDPHTITIDPWDKSVMHNLEKGINESGLGFTANSDGKVIRISLPALTEERKKELVKYAKDLAEESKVVVRNCRRDINNQVKKLTKDGHISEDDEHKELEIIQKATDKHIATIEELIKKKDAEIMEV